jgi:hypothetical protein
MVILFNNVFANGEIFTVLDSVLTPLIVSEPTTESVTKKSSNLVNSFGLTLCSFSPIVQNFCCHNLFIYLFIYLFF